MVATMPHEQVGAVTPKVALQNAAALLDFQMWPLTSELDPTAWLSNFTPEEEVYAATLLSSFMYFSEALTNQLFQTAVHQLANQIGPRPSPFIASSASWNKFLDTTVFTNVEGEDPNPTDSGYLFSRKARQKIGISENNIKSPADTLEAIVTGMQSSVVFVDDFVGSGNQFIETWERTYTLSSGQNTSFAQVSRVLGPIKFYYCVALCTQDAVDRIGRDAPSVLLSAGNTLSREYNAMSPNSLIWPSHLRVGGQEFIRSASARAGITDRNGNVWDWRGFRYLGLTVAFSHSTPDATLPLFYWEENGWHPLVRRN